MSNPIYEETHLGHRIKIYHDTDAESPRDWDNLGTLVCGHSRYRLGDAHRFEDAGEFMHDLCGVSSDCDLTIDQLLKRAETRAVILPVFLSDHSSLAMNTTGFHCPWDSGQVGFIHATLETIRKDYGVVRVSAALREKVADVLKQEVATYSDYLGGSVYGYVVEDEDEEIDSCWGFVGDYDGYCLQEARKAGALV